MTNEDAEHASDDSPIWQNALLPGTLYSTLQEFDTIEVAEFLPLRWVDEMDYITHVEAIRVTSSDGSVKLLVSSMVRAVLDSLPPRFEPDDPMMSPQTRWLS